MLEKYLYPHKDEDHTAGDLGTFFIPRAEYVADKKPYAGKREGYRSDKSDCGKDRNIEEGERNSDGKRVDARCDSKRYHRLEIERRAFLFLLAERLTKHIYAYDKEKSSCIKAYKNEIYFIESNPAFEFWLLLHFVFTDRQFRNCDEVITELKKNGRLEKYEKSIEYFSKNNLYLQLKEKLESAIDHARSISIDINNPHTSYSRVFEVFEELLQKR